MIKPTFSSTVLALIWLIAVISISEAQTAPRQVFGKGHPFTAEELPAGELKSKLQLLNPKAKKAAMAKLHAITFGKLDAAEHLRVHKNGDIYIVCPDGHGNCKGHSKKVDSPDSSAPIAESLTAPTTNSDTTPTVEYAPVSVSAPPVYNSKPGATNHIYIDFNGGVVSGKNWTETDTKGTADTSDDITWTSWDCYPFDMDGNTTTFSDAEQTAMRQIWERVAEDYAPFDVNVTTDITYDSENYTGDKNKVGWLMMTAIVDKNGAYCPHRGAGGVADVGSFGTSVYFRDKQPAWVNTTGGSTLDVAGVAEAASHEMGHNMGLTHDGTSSSAYYGGHLATTSAPSWGPLMGTGYVRNVSQWSKGQYYGANQLQDDLAIITTKIPYRSDDHGDSFASATVWTNSSVDQKGIVERTDNPDYFAFTTAAGTITFNAAAYKCDSSTWGSNLDIILELYNSSQVLVASSNPLTDVNAAISYTATAGDYYLVLKPSAAGSPTVATPSGYTSYGSLGQYTITGSFIPTDALILTSPNGGEIWTRGTTNNITWSSGLGGNVKIELLKNGALYATIQSTTPNNGTCSWSIPANQIVGTNYRLRITSIEQPAKTDTSLTDFTIGTPPAYYASMDTNPGWSLDTGWEYGTPTGGEQDGFGNPDPTSGYNSTKVIGYKLNGDYEPSITTTRWAKTPVIDCSNYSNVKLSFYRWLGVEAGFDRAYIEISNNGTTWTQVWTSPTTTSGGNIEDYVWTYCEYDISAVADGKSTVYIRWGMKSDVEWQWCGWNLDEVRVDGNYNEPNLYIAWSSETFVNPFTDTSLTSNQDGDNLTNLQEFAFGMDPTSSATSNLSFTVDGEFIQAGVPILMNFATTGQPAEYRAVFARRKNHIAAGLTYTVSFSADLQLWTSSNSGLSVLTDPNSASDMEAVSIPFPATVPLQAGGAQQAPKFFRVGVTGGG